MRMLAWTLFAALIVGCGPGKGEDGTTPTGLGNTSPTTSGGGTGIEGLTGIWRIAEVEDAGGVSIEGEGHMSAVWIQATGSSGTMRVHAADVVGGVLDQEPVEEVWTFTTEARSTIVITSPAGTQVFDASGQADTREFRSNANDARNDVSAADAISSMRLERLEAPSIEGSWAATSYRFAGTLTPLDTCFAVGTAVWMVQSISLEVDAAGVVSMSAEGQLFDDENCTVASSPLDAWQGTGFWRDTNPPIGDLWMASSDGSTWDLYNAQFDGPDLSLDRLECRPDPDCWGEGFDTVEFSPAP